MSRAEAATDGFDELVDWVARSGIQPVDSMHLAAMLEMNGWTDRRAATLGYEDVFQLAAAIYDVTRTQFHHDAGVPEEKVAWWRSIARTVWLYMHGLAFAMPMLLSSFAVLTLQYSFVSYMGFSVQIATAIALGTFASFFVAGGFSQAIARRGLFYISQNLYYLGRRSSVNLLLVGGAVTVLLGLLGGLLMLIVPVLPWSMLGLIALFYFLLTPIWLGTALLYMLQRTQVVLVLFALGIGAVYVQVEVYAVAMIRAQAGGMAVIAAGALLIGILFLLRLERHEDMRTGSGTAMLPQWSQVTRTLAPYFLYGTIYFSLLFADRILAWSVPAEFHPFVIWFIGDYELGLIWALWTLVLPMGAVEVYIHVLFYRINRRRQVTSIERRREFNRRFQRDHLLMSALVSAGGLVSIALIVYLLSWLTATGFLPWNPLGQPVTRMVFFVAAPAYSILTVGLKNSVVLFSLNHPWPCVRAVSTGLVVNVIVGFLASRYGGYHWAVFGLLTGSITFAVVSWREVLRLLSELDYHLMRAT